MIARSAPSFSPAAGVGAAHFSLQVDSTSVDHLLMAARMSFGAASLSDFMRRKVQPYFADKIVGVFGDQGAPDHVWAPLKESTLRIRHALGFMDDEAINERTGEMLNHLISSSVITASYGSAQMAIPGDSGSPLMQKKISTAQHGDNSMNDLFGRPTSTPPRPVLAVNPRDLASVIALFQVHVVEMIAMMHGPGVISNA